MASANEVETQGENGHVGHLSSERQTVAIQDVGYFSSSPLESPPRSPFSTLDTDLSLGVFFSPDEGEANDVLAAMRASQRVVKETREAVMVHILCSSVSLQPSIDLCLGPAATNRTNKGVYRDTPHPGARLRDVDIRWCWNFANHSDRDTFATDVRKVGGLCQVS